MIGHASTHRHPIYTLTQEQIFELTTIQNLLALAWHRNKNQHRRSRWWAEFGALKRGVERLIAAFEVGHGGGGKDQIGLRVKFLKDEMLERCWLAFSAVIADNQYAALGLMLLGTLARLGKVLGVEKEFHFQPALEGEEVAELVSETVRAEARKILGGNVGEDVDIGVVLRREELRMDVESTEGIVTDTWTGAAKRPTLVGGNTDSLMPDSGTSVPTLASTIKPKKKRKRKKSDEFDELFSSLI